MPLVKVLASPVSVTTRPAKVAVFTAAPGRVTSAVALQVPDIPLAIWKTAKVW